MFFKKHLLILFIPVLISCAGLPVSESGDIPAAPEKLSLQAVVDTGFEGSYRYGEFAGIRTEGPLIPGLLQEAVPQGMAYWEEEELFVISNYMSSGTAGALTFIKPAGDEFIKTLYLYNSDGSPHTGHLGGLALGAGRLWIASGSGVFFIELVKLAAAADGEKIVLPVIIPTETRGSFAAFFDDVLWVGEFTRADGSYASARHHHGSDRTGRSRRAWLAGYTIAPDGDFAAGRIGPDGKVVPDFIISIPDEVQGAAMTEDRIYLSASYGRKNDSRLLVYDSPLSGPRHGTADAPTGEKIPLRFLDDLNKSAEITLPPMSEAAVVFEDSIAVLFESAASKYRDTSSSPLDRIQYLRPE